MSDKAKDGALDERAQYLLKVLIDRYLREGHPVGSRTLSHDSALELSPATIRNVMADLEELGLIRSPHTSAGRIPTSRGLRLFVDCLLKVEPLELQEVARIQTQLSQEENVKELMAKTSSMLSQVTSLAGVVTLPKREGLVLRQVEFLPLSGQRVLVILVVNDSDVQNRIIHTARPYSDAELTQMANYLNSIFAGRDLNETREELLKDMRSTREHMNQLMLDAVTVAGKAFSDDQSDYVLAGEANLLGLDELSDTERLRQLFEAFNEKQRLLHLLDQALRADGIQIYIGKESGYTMLDDCSVVTAPYEAGGQMVGVLGVIGPKRMAYDRVIPIVDLTAKLLGSALNQEQ